MKVKATKLGYYSERRYRPGQTFFLKDAKHFTESWMEKLSNKKGHPKKEAVSVPTSNSNDEVI